MPNGQLMNHKFEPLNNNEIWYNAEKVFVVIVTYGNRYSYVENLTNEIIKYPIGKIIIVANKPTTQSLKLLEALGKKIAKLEIITNQANVGSALGFGTGINSALNCKDCQFVWLLDDDVLPKSNALPILLNNWLNYHAKYGKENLAFTCFRPDHQFNIQYGKKVLYLRRGSFLSFHFFNLPYKVMKLIAHNSRKRIELPELMVVPYTGYAGFFAHRELYEKIGLPSQDFVLYQDDLEYTFRVTQKGGKIFLCGLAWLNSSETSWDLIPKFMFGIQALFDSTEDFRVYYGVRNQVYFEKNYYNNALLRVINKTIFLLLLNILGIVRKKKQRLELIYKAIMDGERGNLGFNTCYRLP